MKKKYQLAWADRNIEVKFYRKQEKWGNIAIAFIAGITLAILIGRLFN